MVIVGAGQMAAPLQHGYTAESAVSTRLILVNGTTVPIVAAYKLVCGG